MEAPFDIGDIADFAYVTRGILKDKKGEEKGAVFYGGEKAWMNLTTSSSAPTARWNRNRALYSSEDRTGCDVATVIRVL